MDPVDIRRLLPWIWLTEVQRDPLRFKYRLVGTVHVEAFGEDATGQWYDDAQPRFRGSVDLQQFAAVADHGRIAFYRGPPIYVVDATWKTIERLILPLAQNGHDVDMLLGMTVIDPVPPSA